MTDLHELLTDAVADVEPGYALDDIRARTTPTRRRWPYAAGGAVLAIAASVAAFAVLTPDHAPRATDPGSTTSPSATATATELATDLPQQGVEVYYVGDTPDGPRLFSENRMVQAANPLEAAIAALEQTPLDPDYRTYWPAGAIESIHFDGIGGDGVFGVVLTDTSLHDRPASMDEATAQMAIAQVMYTLQKGANARAAVSFSFDHNPIDQVFGVPTSEPLTTGVVLDTLAHVSITTPSEGMLVDNDEPLVVEGVGNSFEGNIVTRIQRWEGTHVVDQKPAIAGMGEDRLFPFEITFDLTGVPPGDYVVISQSDDPSGQGRFDTDTRRITVVD
ncbi:MAG: Gmad2 immunoglobulin-like domain-containing protein [Nocardioides sp.]|uniref:Gmad2 immunoglobulin-like domain-containing protein n=1 Tax=Nocardioides sp. TaxID=35761 RepID=UPI003263FDC0